MQDIIITISNKGLSKPVPADKVRELAEAMTDKALRDTFAQLANTCEVMREIGKERQEAKRKDVLEKAKAEWAKLGITMPDSHWEALVTEGEIVATPKVKGASTQSNGSRGRKTAVIEAEGCPLIKAKDAELKSDNNASYAFRNWYMGEGQKPANAHGLEKHGRGHQHGEECKVAA